jgi:inhibitor of KinA
MFINSYNIFPLGIDALTVDFGNEISEKLNQQVLSLADYLENHQFNGFCETVPAFSSLTIFFDPKTVRKEFSNFPTAFEVVKSFIETALKQLTTKNKKKSKVIEISVSFDDEFAPDLEFVGTAKNLTKSEVIEIFLARTYRVFMLGFLPGFAYMGEIDEQIVAPRKETPRTKVTKGSVGIAGRQTGIYPFDSPGGWQIIGKTNLELFTPHQKLPTLFKAGDLVKFIQAK